MQQYKGAFPNAFSRESSTIQDGITSRLVYISDEIRDKLLLNDKSILPDNFHWSLTNDSLSVGYIFTQPNSTKSFLVNVSLICMIDGLDCILCF